METVLQQDCEAESMIAASDKKRRKIDYLRKTEISAMREIFHNLGSYLRCRLFDCFPMNKFVFTKM